MPQSQGYIAMGWALVGSPKFRIQGTNLRAFRKFEDLTAGQQYGKELFAIAGEYAKVVADAFNRAHGRTGATAKGVTLDYRRTSPDPTGARPTQVIGVKFANNIVAVVNPLPPHVIQVKKARFLSNLKTAPYRGETDRTSNFYYEFPQNDQTRLTSVEWYQGGDDSHSPDRTWFEEGAAREILEVESLARMGALAEFSKVLWAKEYSGFEVIVAGNNQFIPMPRE